MEKYFGGRQQKRSLESAKKRPASNGPLSIKYKPITYVHSDSVTKGAREKRVVDALTQTKTSQYFASLETPS
jgi:hypothetical protein